MSLRQRLPVSIALVLLLLARPAPAQPPANPVVVLETTVGNITVELFADKAPITVENFLTYARSGFYAGTIFHRVIRDFMVQGGGLTPQLRQKPARPPIKNEASQLLRNVQGTVAAARSGGVNTATAQFFINLKDNTQLDHRSIRPEEFGYAVFGRVIEGMDVVDKIGQARTNGKDVPQSLHMITRVSVKETP